MIGEASDRITLPIDMKKLRAQCISRCPYCLFRRQKRHGIPKCCPGGAHILAQGPHNPVGPSAVSEDADGAWAEVSLAMGSKVGQAAVVGSSRTVDEANNDANSCPELSEPLLKTNWDGSSTYCRPS